MPTLTIDPATGLPALPEDYYWELVQTGPSYSYKYHFNLKRISQYDFGMDRTIESKYMDWVTKKRLKRQARRLYYKNWPKNPEPVDKRVNKLVGKYPPNSVA